MTSTYPSEVVSCRLADGVDVRVFCKYGADRPAHLDGGHRGGVGYEAAVYRDVLRSSGVSVPRFYSSYTDPGTGAVWLFVEYLPRAARVSKSPGAMGLAARWLGEFHQTFEGRPAPGLNCYDADYYRAWARRAAEFASPWRHRFPWVEALCDRFAGQTAADLCRLPVTVVHGELYPCNVLVCGGAVYPIDWESAAAGPGEIDFASLTEGWPMELAAECVREYCAARWPGGAPADFGKRVAAARLYWALRWLGRPPAPLTDEKSRRYLRYFDQLYAAGRTLGLIEE
jgi:aminoglycoside phosphotransferase (APT) family kinase protein